MVKSIAVTVNARLPMLELESGTYKLVTHSKYFEVAPEDVEAFKTDWARAIEEEGKGEITVESVRIFNVPAGKVEPDYIDIDGPREILEDHTAVETIFTVSSPFPWLALLVCVALAIVAIIGYSPAFQKIVDVLYKIAADIPWWVWAVVILTVSGVGGVYVYERLSR